ncbi:MAG TPA: M48 family metallopeptidase [Polyangia bacterium]|nr:M48 family metallopeptidase [Polyangia bacterium]
MKKTTLRVATLALVLGGGCATSTTRSLETTLAEAMVTPDQENQLGLQLKQDLDTNQHAVYMTDPEVVTYVQTVAGKVIALGKKDRPDVTWQVFVLDDRKTVNAFATPGGYLYVYRGLLEMADNEAELAAVMAHETGHVVARHAARSMVASYGLDAVAKMAGGENPGLLTQLTTTIAGKGILLSHSRADETEADEYGARYAAGAGYDPHAFASFFQRLQAQEGSSPKIMNYLSDHPATGDRITHINAYIAANNLSGSNLGEADYAKIKRRLATLPSATPAPAAAKPSGPPAGAPPAAP